MILVDSSVWVDYFRGVDTAEADKLDNFLGVEQVVIGDLILTEVLQGFISEREFNRGRKLLASLPMIPLVGGEIAVQAARNFRKLRVLGITIRKTIDTLIATSCIESFGPIAAAPFATIVRGLENDSWQFLRNSLRRRMRAVRRRCRVDQSLELCAMIHGAV